MRTWAKARRLPLAVGAGLIAPLATWFAWPFPLGSGPAAVHSWEVIAAHGAAVAAFGFGSRMRGWDRLATPRVAHLDTLAALAVIAWFTAVPWLTMTALDRVPHTWIPWVARAGLAPTQHVSELTDLHFLTVLTLNGAASAAAALLLIATLGRPAGLLLSLGGVWLLAAAGFSSGAPVLRLGHLQPISPLRIAAVTLLAATAIARWSRPRRAPTRLSLK